MAGQTGVACSRGWCGRSLDIAAGLTKVAFFRGNKTRPNIKNIVGQNIVL